MTIKFVCDSKDISYRFSQFENRQFILEKLDNGESTNKDDENKFISVESPLELDNVFEKEGKEFDVYFLAKKDLKENNIFTIHSKQANNESKRIGWLISINSLDSTEHDFSENPHYLKYAYIGARDALKTADYEQIYLKNIDSNSSIVLKFSDIFHESTALLIINKQTLKDNMSFDLDRVMPSLIKYGYTKLTTVSPNEIQFCGDLEDALTNKKIQLDLISEYIKDYCLVSQLLSDTFVYEKKAVFRFFWLYQIFELLISDINEKELDFFVERIQKLKGQQLEIDKLLRNPKEKFGSEEKRFNLLISKYSNSKSKLNDLKVVCNNLLLELGKDSENDFEAYFYPIRNFIFHQYRNFPDNANELLNEVVNETINVLPDILSKYKIPNE
jgi:hypothetical protein